MNHEQIVIKALQIEYESNESNLITVIAPCNNVSTKHLALTSQKWLKNESNNSRCGFGIRVLIYDSMNQINSIDSVDNESSDFINPNKFVYVFDK